MENFIITTFDLMDKTMFSPLVLIGLLITSLSLVINLKNSDNQNIQKFRRHKNIYKFIDTIFYTATALLVLFLLSLVVNYFCVSLQNVNYIKETISIFYLIDLIYIAYSLFIIVYTLQEIVKTSLKSDM